MSTRKNETMNSIQREVYTLQPLPVSFLKPFLWLEYFGFQNYFQIHMGRMTDIYVYVLVSQLVCLIMIALLVLLQRCTNLVL